MQSFIVLYREPYQAPPDAPFGGVTGEMRFNPDHLRAYAAGYWDGRHEGVDTCPFQDDTTRHLYRQGYEAGVADFAEAVE